MLLKKLFLFVAVLFSISAEAQQVAHASNVQLVSTPGVSVITQGGIKFTGTTVFKDSGTTTLLLNPIAGMADWVDSTATGVLVNPYGITIFGNASNVQELIGPTTFYNLRMNGIGANLHQTNEVTNILRLDTGLVYFQNPVDSIYVSNPALAAITSTSAYNKSWVHGKLRRAMNLTGVANEYLFPIGKMNGPDSLYAPIKIEKFNTTLNSYTAVYFPSVPFDNTNIQNPPIDHISDVENWDITASTPTGPDAEAKVALSWRTYSLVSPLPAVRDSLLVVQYVDNPTYRWYKLGASTLHQVSGASTAFGYVKHPDFLGAFSFDDRRHTLGTLSKYNALPIRLLYWTALADGNKVRLIWNVEQEYDCLKYDVEKSLDGVNFSHLLTVPSLQKAAWQYTEFDYNPVTGWNFYRLKITDKSQQVSYAGIRKVKFGKGLEIVSVFPNPASQMINVIMPSSYQGKVTLQLFAADGKFISTLRPSSTNVQMNVGSLSGGAYFIRLIHINGTTETYPFIKQ